MAHHRWSLLVAVLLALGQVRAARADPTTDLARHLDGDVTAVLRLDFTELENLVELYRTSGRPGAENTVLLASAAGLAGLGFDPLVAAGWLAAGFDSTAPILIGLAAIDEQAAAARFGGAAKRPVWRSRLIARAADPPRAEATLRKLAGLLPDLYPVTPANGSALSRALGTTGDPAALVAELGRAGVVVAGRLPAPDTLILAHLDRDTVIVDLLSGFAAPLRWRDDRGAITRLLGRRPRPALAARLGRGAAARLRGPGTVLWLDPRRLLIVHEALRQQTALAERRRDPGASVEPRPAACQSFDQIADAGPFTDLALTFRVTLRDASHGPRVAMTTAWGLRAAYRLAASLLVEDDGLLDPRDAVAHHGAALAAVTHLRGLDPLRHLPRPALLDRRRPDIQLALEQCGAAAGAVLIGFGWPQLLGAKLDEIASIDPDAATLVGAARNAALAVRHIGPQLRTLIGAGELSFDPAAAPLIEKYYRTVFGGPNSRRFGGLRFTTWGHGRIRPYRLAHDDHPRYGAGVGNRGLTWYLALGRPAPERHPALALLIADPTRIAAQLAQNPDRTLSAIGRRLTPVAATLAGFEATLRLSGGLLEATSLWSLR